MSTVTTRSMQRKRNASSCAAVFDVVELAEMIFLELPMRDILVGVQRTSKIWKGVVESSSKLQVAIFQRPSLETALYCPDEGISNKQVSILAHPILSSAIIEEASAHEAMQLPNGSWQRQLVTQPAIDVIPIQLIMHNAHKVHVNVYARSGRLGVIWDDVIKVLSKQGVGSGPGEVLPEDMILCRSGVWPVAEWKEECTYGQIQRVNAEAYYDPWEFRQKALEVVDMSERRD